MKGKSTIQIICITCLCICVNLLGKQIAAGLQMPVWFDSIGTMGMAYYAGPVCAAFVGLTGNVVNGFFEESQTLYAFVSIVIAAIVGYGAKKKSFERLFNVLSLGMVLALACTVMSAFLGLVFYHGDVGNIWEEQLYAMFQSLGLRSVTSYVIAIFYVEFLDKSLSALIIFAFLRLYRYERKRKEAKKSQATGLGLLIGALLFGLMMGNTSYAKEQGGFAEYTQTTYAGAEGLTAGEANDIAQSKNGLLWIGTYAGLYSYDGIRFSLHNEFETIKNVNCLYEDEEGRLFVGTNDNGVSIVIDETVVNSRSEEDGLPSNSVRAIVCDTYGNYYIGTSNGVAVLSLSGGCTLTDNLMEISDAISMTSDAYGNVVAVTDSGRMFLIRQKQVIAEYKEQESEDIYTTAYFDTDNRLIVGDAKGNLMVYIVSGDRLLKSKTIPCPGSGHINRLYRVESGELFVCSDKGIGYLGQNNQYVMLNTNSFTSSVTNMTVDYQGDLWFTSSRLGLLKLCASSFEEIFSEMGFEENVVNAILKWNGMMIYGTDKGIKIVDDAKQEPVENELTEFFTNVRIRGLMVDSEDDLWIATGGKGLFQISYDNISQGIFKHYGEENGAPSERYRGVIQLQDGGIMACGDDGICQIENGEVVAAWGENDDLINVKTLCLYQADNGVVYAGSNGGGITLIQDGAIIGKLTREDGLSSGVVMKLVCDPQTGMIFAVTSNGICSIDPSNNAITYLDQFPYSNNYDIIPDGQGKVWITCSAGIYIADIDMLLDNEPADYELINAKRGLRSGLVANSSNYKAEDGMLYLCGGTGAFAIDMFRREEKSYRMVLDKVFVDGQVIKMGRDKTCTLDSSASRLELSPKILNYSLNDPYISYYMEGVDASPTIILLSQLESIVYTNFKAGSYTFELSVLDNSKRKVLEKISYKFEKQAEMYQKIWFRVYVVLVALMVVIWITWFITRMRSQKAIMKKELELEYAKKQIEMGNETILSIAKTVDAKDSRTSQHSFRVSEYSVILAKKIGYPKEKLEDMRRMALLHDIGKIGIPDAILNKPDKLTDEEYAIMKSHVIRGSEILKDFTLIDNVGVGALYHHEHYDGQGYMYGLKGEEIPLEARIIGIADAFDAMTANRVYRKHLDMGVVVEEIQNGSGKQFDPALVDAMLELIADGSIDVNRYFDQINREV